MSNSDVVVAAGAAPHVDVVDACCTDTALRELQLLHSAQPLSGEVVVCDAMQFGVPFEGRCWRPEEGSFSGAAHCSDASSDTTYCRRSAAGSGMSIATSLSAPFEVWARTRRTRSSTGVTPSLLLTALATRYDCLGTLSWTFKNARWGPNETCRVHWLGAPRDMLTDCKGQPTGNAECDRPPGGADLLSSLRCASLQVHLQWRWSLSQRATKSGTLLPWPLWRFAEVHLVLRNAIRSEQREVEVTVA
ncbi:hypothetical protein CUR178_07690 [Leishmania enriettii]|uniref:Uncharacterized protein n=1 Tax=Leishmania enriettii TaxID=5663 RepID=A0A836HHL7_LEIEN|nr:hypothetical protein CUR178_07690 [Leishmania enriettii]